MSEQTAKPYLVRAIYEWCSDQGFTPYLAVRVNSQTRVPQGFVKNGEIVLNVSATATRHLKIDNDWIQFSARFNGVSNEVSVPMNAVAGIFARETGYGFAFAVQAEQAPTGVPAVGGETQAASDAQPASGPAPVPAGAAPALTPVGPAAPTEPDDGKPAGTPPSGPDRPRGRPNLQVIK